MPKQVVVSTQTTRAFVWRILYGVEASLPLSLRQRSADYMSMSHVKLEGCLIVYVISRDQQKAGARCMRPWGMNGAYGAEWHAKLRSRV